MASLYLHIPFCEHKCIYCDFYSIESLDPMDRFLEALQKEITLHAHYQDRDQFETIFFGGGTPSLLAPATVDGILNTLNATFNITPDAEITIEANPGTVDKQKLEGFRAAGVNRISFGVQSFHDDDLRFLTRIHSAAEAKTAVHAAKEAGFANVNLDLIFALPHQTISRWKNNLLQAIDLEPQHISAYGLIVERNTPLARMVNTKQVSPLPTELEAEMYICTMDTLQDAGYEHYEVSNYCKAGFYSRHNSNYWNHANYLGFGPSAHSFWSNRRWWNVANVRSYCDRVSAGALPVIDEETLTESQLIDERVMLGLRSNGVNLHKLNDDFGIDVLAHDRSTISALIDDHLAAMDGSSLHLTNKGFLLCDEITQRILAELSYT